MDTDVYDEIDGIEAALRKQAAECEEKAEQLRNEARALDGRADGLRCAAVALRDIERPQ